VLDILERQRMSATFFVLGRHITARSYHLLQRMEVEGHVIGSHSYDHDLHMAYRDDAGAVAYIRGQHEVTRVLIELALLARSPADFDALAGEVLGVSPERRLPSAALEGGAVEILERHRSALAERGYPGGRYPVRYSRPPGGGPYLGRSQAPRARYDAALAELGMLNVLWHRLSGDVDASRAREYGFLTANVTAAAGRGGVLLLHDFIRSDALERALGDIARDPTVAVVGIDEAVADKYRCPSSELTRLLDERRGLLSSARLEAQRTLIIG
jgi:peptidoglycan/xylan/chitin deacetylase (PgdA/CDA1 family)